MFLRKIPIRTWLLIKTQIKDWKFQYNTLQLENAKLKTKNKFTKIGAGLIAGGLVYLMLVK